MSIRAQRPESMGGMLTFRGGYTSHVPSNNKRVVSWLLLLRWTASTVPISAGECSYDKRWEAEEN
jgi:hypothetical protein